jgi:hypothetical protein
VGCPDWEEHRRQDLRRYAKDTVDSTLQMVKEQRATFSVPGRRSGDAAGRQTGPLSAAGSGVNVWEGIGFSARADGGVILTSGAAE